ncbi:MAG: Peptidase lon N-terminal [Proteobacteria bacterium]|nr:Peptidase lon N-terminal [Pseudomonadota bacterium]
MGFFSFLHRPQTPQEQVIPLFPLNTVLFPGGILGLKVFEPRYLDMTAVCLREKTAFGICLVSGRQEDDVLATHPVGTMAWISQADMEQAGILMLTVHGRERFRILETTRQEDGLLRARVQLLTPAEKVSMPPERNRLLPLLTRIVSDLGSEKVVEPYDFEDAEWVGFRLTEVLPVQNLAKQKLLELDDALERLEILEKYLDQKKLL